MFGPVARLEWLHASRRGRHHLLRGLYVLALFAESLVFLLLGTVRTYATRQAAVGERLEAIGALQLGFLVFLLAQHFALLALATPTLAAGAIADEKSRGSLGLLLTTDLRVQEIVVGKWLGQVMQVMLLAAPIFPLLALFGFLCGFGWAGFGAWLAASLVLVMTLAALALLASVWARRTSTAVFVVYLVAGTMAGVAFASNMPALGGWSELLLFSALRPSVAAVGVAVTGVCLAVACCRLRPAYAKQLSAETTRRDWLRWIWRPAVGANPLRWKECYTGDPGLLAFLQRWPRGLRLAGVGAASFVAWWLVGAEGWRVSLPGLVLAETILCGLLVMLVASYAAGVRASATVSGERERQSWDNLLATPLTSRQLVRGKVWGVMDAARPYLVAYIVPAFVAGLLGGFWMAAAVLVFWLFTWGMLYYHVANGVYWSVRSANSWESMLKSAASSVRDMIVRGFFVSLPAAFFLLMLLGLGAQFLLGWLLPTQAFAVIGAIAFFGPAVIALFGHAEELLQNAEKHLANEERLNQ